MTKRELATLCCRGIAILFLGYSLDFASMMFVSASYMLLAVAITSVQLLSAVLLWVFARSFANWIFSEDGDAGIQINATALELLMVFVAAFGLTLVVQMVPGIVKALPLIVEKSQAGASTSREWLNSGIISFIVGVALISSAFVICRLQRGQETTSQQPTDDDQ